MQLLVQVPHISLSFDKENNWLYANWTGDQTVESVKDGCTRMLELVQKMQLTKVLNDNREVSSSWAGAAEWIGTEWFPALLAAGVRCFGHIYSPFEFSRLAADTSISYAKTAPQIQTFDSYPEAEMWLSRCS